MTMTPAPWLIRLAKLNALVNVPGLQGGEHDDQHQQPEDGGKRPDVAAADLGDVVAAPLARARLASLRLGGVLELGLG